MTGVSSGLIPDNGRSSEEKKLWPPAKGLTGVKPKKLRIKTKDSEKPSDSVCELCVCRK